MRPGRSSSQVQPTSRIRHKIRFSKFFVTVQSYRTGNYDKGAVMHGLENYGDCFEGEPDKSNYKIQ